MQIDNLLILVAGSARGMTQYMSYQEEEIDSSFSLQNQGAYCVSICKVQILVQHRSRFLC